MMNRINPIDSNNVFACSQNVGCARSDNAGNTMTSIRARFAGTRFNWLSPPEIAADGQAVYFGSNILNRSDDRGVTWRAVSPDLTGGPTPRNSTSCGTIRGQAFALGRTVNRRQPFGWRQFSREFSNP